MRMTSLAGGIRNVAIPTAEDIAGLKAGDLAPDYMGRMSPVTRIFATGETREGLAYVCYYVEHGKNGSVSDCLVENTVHRNMALSIAMTSAEIDAAEIEARKDLGNIQMP